MLGGHSCTLDLRVRRNPKGSTSSCWDTGHVHPFHGSCWGWLWILLWDSCSAFGILGAGLCVELCGSAPAKGSCFFFSLSALVSSWYCCSVCCSILNPK